MLLFEKRTSSGWVELSDTWVYFSYSFHVPGTIISSVWSQSKANVVNHLFFWSSNIFFAFFNFLKHDPVHNVVWTLINVEKPKLKTTTLLWHWLTLLINMKVEIDNVDSTFFNVVNFNFDIHNVVSTLIWHCPTSRGHPNNNNKVLIE